ADARRQAERYRKVVGVGGGDQQSALPDEVLDLLESVPAEAGADVVGGIDLAEIRSELRRLPRQRIAVHRRAVDDRLGTAANAGSEDDHVVLGAQVLLRHRLRAEV